jgi:hypothetical protein
MNNSIIADITDFIFIVYKPRKVNAIFLPGGSDPAQVQVSGAWHGGLQLLIPR